MMGFHNTNGSVVSNKQEYIVKVVVSDGEWQEIREILCNRIAIAMDVAVELQGIIGDIPAEQRAIHKYFPASSIPYWTVSIVSVDSGIIERITSVYEAHIATVKRGLPND